MMDGIILIPNVKIQLERLTENKVLTNQLTFAIVVATKEKTMKCTKWLVLVVLIPIWSGGCSYDVLDKVQKEEGVLEEYGLKATFEPLTAWLRDNAGTLTESPPCLIHQDFHPRNILLRSDGSPVVIDWATCTIGDFREDLCWTGLLAGTFIDESLKKAIYDSYGEASPRVLVDLPYFEVYAGLRRLADVAVAMKAGAAARGMRPEAIREMEENRPHYAKVLKVVTDATGAGLPELARLLGV